MATIISKEIYGSGPYYYHVEYVDGEQVWTYLGKSAEVSNPKQAAQDEGLCIDDSESNAEMDIDELPTRKDLLRSGEIADYTGWVANSDGDSIYYIESGDQKGEIVHEIGAQTDKIVVRAEESGVEELVEEVQSGDLREVAQKYADGIEAQIPQVSDPSDLHGVRGISVMDSGDGDFYKLVDDDGEVLTRVAKDIRDDGYVKMPYSGNKEVKDEIDAWILINEDIIQNRERVNDYDTVDELTVEEHPTEDYTGVSGFEQGMVVKPRNRSEVELREKVYLDKDRDEVHEEGFDEDNIAEEKTGDYRSEAFRTDSGGILMYQGYGAQGKWGAHKAPSYVTESGSRQKVDTDETIEIEYEAIDSDGD